MQRIQQVGVTLSLDPLNEGSYVVSAWIKVDGVGFTNPVYVDHVSFTEAIDVVLVTLDENRPGFDLEGQGQPSLW